MHAGIPTEVHIYINEKRVQTSVHVNDKTLYDTKSRCKIDSLHDFICQIFQVTVTEYFYEEFPGSWLPSHPFQPYAHRFPTTCFRVKEVLFLDAPYSISVKIKVQ